MLHNPRMPNSIFHGLRPSLIILSLAWFILSTTLLVVYRDEQIFWLYKLASYIGNVLSLYTFIYLLLLPKITNNICIYFLSKSIFHILQISLAIVSLVTMVILMSSVTKLDKPIFVLIIMAHIMSVPLFLLHFGSLCIVLGKAIAIFLIDSYIYDVDLYIPLDRQQNRDIVFRRLQPTNINIANSQYVAPVYNPEPQNNQIHPSAPLLATEI